MPSKLRCIIAIQVSCGNQAPPHANTTRFRGCPLRGPSAWHALISRFGRKRTSTCFHGHTRGSLHARKATQEDSVVMTADKQTAHMALYTVCLGKRCCCLVATLLV